MVTKLRSCVKEFPSNQIYLRSLTCHFHLSQEMNAREIKGLKHLASIHTLYILQAYIQLKLWIYENKTMIVKQLPDGQIDDQTSYFQCKYELHCCAGQGYIIISRKRMWVVGFSRNVSHNSIHICYDNHWHDNDDTLRNENDDIFFSNLLELHMPR